MLSFLIYEIVATFFLATATTLASGVTIYADKTPPPPTTPLTTNLYQNQVNITNFPNSHLSLEAYAGLHCTGAMIQYNEVLWSAQNAIGPEALSFIVSRNLTSSELIDWSTYLPETNATAGPNKKYSDGDGGCSQYLVAVFGDSARE